MKYHQNIDIFFLLPSMEGGEGEKSNQERRSGSRSIGVMTPGQNSQTFGRWGVSGPIAGGSEGVTCSVTENEPFSPKINSVESQNRLSFSLTSSDSRLSPLKGRSQKLWFFLEAVRTLK